MAELAGRIEGGDYNGTTIPTIFSAISISLLRISSRQPGEIQAGQDSVQQYSRNILLANVREGKEEEKNATG